MTIQDNQTAANTAAKIDAPAPAIRNTSQRKDAPREREQRFGGPRLKLSVLGTIPGYHLYWENDDEGAIETLLYEGFEFVNPSEVKMQSHVVMDTDVSDRLSRYVGKKADGTPLRAFLLKCSDEHWQERELYRYEQADEWESDIKRRVNEPEKGRYNPKGVNNELDTHFTPKMK